MPYFVICRVIQGRVVKRFAKTFNYYSSNFVTQLWINTGSMFNMIFVHGSGEVDICLIRNLERQYSAFKSLISSGSCSMFKLFYSQSLILLLKHHTAK